jgi:ATP-dependent Clp protease ATP-binding subunit ClpB
LNIEKFTLKSKEALRAAQSLAEQNNNQEVKGVHLVRALISQGSEGIIPPLLKKIGVNTDIFNNELNQIIKKEVSVQGDGAEAPNIFCSPLKKMVPNKLKTSWPNKE